MQDFLLFALVGFLAQAVDGALGMAYGVISSTTLLAFGVAPAHASAAVHAAELFTTAASGTAHFYHRNIDWKLFWRLAPFGILGGCVGAYVLTSFDGSIVKPFVTGYLALVGAWLLFRSFRKIPSRPVPAPIVAPLGAAGGFLDAAGGGGWGPVVASNLIARGGDPGKMVGTVNLAEFFVTLAVSGAFLLALGATFGKAALGLLVGGVLAAPVAVFAARRIPRKLFTIIVGVAICLVSAWNLWRGLVAL